MNGVFTSRGMKTRASMPAFAAYAARAHAAFPADGTERVAAPRAWARVTAADMPRALNELVGLSASSLTKSRSSPRSAPRAGAGKRGVQPSPSVTGRSPSARGRAGAYRHIDGTASRSDSRGHSAAMRAQS